VRPKLHRKLDFKKPLYVQKAFKSGTRLFKLGELFNWKKIGVERRRVAQLFDVRYIDHDWETPAPPIEEKIKKLKKEVSIQPLVVEEPPVIEDQTLDLVQEEPETHEEELKVLFPQQQEDALNTLYRIMNENK
jgi:hypothetical protein